MPAGQGCLVGCNREKEGKPSALQVSLTVSQREAEVIYSTPLSQAAASQGDPTGPAQIIQTAFALQDPHVFSSAGEGLGPGDKP